MTFSELIWMCTVRKGARAKIELTATLFTRHRLDPPTALTSQRISCFHTLRFSLPGNTISGASVNAGKYMYIPVH